MFRFENEIVLYGFIIIPILVAGYLFVIQKNKKKWLQYGDPQLIEKLMPERSGTMQHLKCDTQPAEMASWVARQVASHQCRIHPHLGSGPEKTSRGCAARRLRD